MLEQHRVVAEDIAMRALSPDTSPEVERLHLAIMARLPAWRKMELIAGINALLSGPTVAGFKKRHLGAGDNALWRRLDEQRLGSEVACQLEVAREVRRITLAEDVYVAGDPLPTILAVIAVLDRLAIPYYIGGSIASGIHGMYRATADVDVVADVHEAQVDELVRLPGQRFYADAGRMRDAIQQRSAFNALDLNTGFKVDVFIPQERAFDRSQFERRVLAPLAASGEKSVYVSSVESTVLAKMEGYRAGGEVSERQWNDIVGVLKVKASEVDQAYLRYWAAQLGLTDVLDRALDDAGL